MKFKVGDIVKVVGDFTKFERGSIVLIESVDYISLSCFVTNGTSMQRVSFTDIDVIAKQVLKMLLNTCYGLSSKMIKQYVDTDVIITQQLYNEIENKRGVKKMKSCSFSYVCKIDDDYKQECEGVKSTLVLRSKNPSRLLEALIFNNGEKDVPTPERLLMKLFDEELAYIGYNFIIYLECEDEENL